MPCRTGSPAPFGLVSLASAPRRLFAATLALAGCGAGRSGRGDGEASPPEPPLAGPKLFDDARVESPTGGGGAGTAQAPIPRCGPQDSYRYVADGFRCPGGGNPFAGDPAAARRARAGSLGPTAEGHMIDVYEVPCPEGKVEVFVDMYGCPEMERRLVHERAALDPLELDVRFAAGRYDEVRARCEALAGDRGGADAEGTAMSVYHCAIFTPALLLRTGEPERAVAAAARTCQGYPPVSGRSTIRVDVLVGMVDAIARMWAADKVPLKEGSERLNAILAQLLRACAVDATTFMRAFEAASGG